MIVSSAEGGGKQGTVELSKEMTDLKISQQVRSWYLTFFRQGTEAGKASSMYTTSM